MKMRVGKNQADGSWYEGGSNELELTSGRESTKSEASQVEYQFYSKPMSSPIATLQRSALPEGTKVARMVSKIDRRWKNTWAEFELITMSFMDNLRGMGYQEWWRKKVSGKALTGYKRILRKAENGQKMRKGMGWPQT